MNIFNRSATIAALFCMSGPLAVFGGISFAVVYPLNAVFAGWTKPHVLNKSVWRIFPTVAHSDTSTTIVGKSLIFWVVAATHHAVKRPVFNAKVEPVPEIAHNFFTAAMRHSAVTQF